VTRGADLPGLADGAFGVVWAAAPPRRFDFMQTFIRNRWLNYEGRTISGFYVYSISSQVTANRDGSPNYDVRCLKCNRYEIKNQRELTHGANGAMIFCSNKTCVASKVQHPESESLADLKRQEREQEARTQREQAAGQVLRKQEVAKQRSERADKSRWLVLANSQLKSGIEIDSPEWVSFERWQRWSPEFQADILKRIADLDKKVSSKDRAPSVSMLVPESSASTHSLLFLGFALPMERER
jgi:hypothetical protein